MSVKPNFMPTTPPSGLDTFSTAFPTVPYHSASGSNVPICQLCNKEGHAAPVCGFRGYERPRCNVCGKPNHATWYCYYNEHGPNFIGNGNGFEAPASMPNQHQAMYTIQNAYSSL